MREFFVSGEWSPIRQLLADKPNQDFGFDVCRVVDSQSSEKQPQILRLPLAALRDTQDDSSVGNRRWLGGSAKNASTSVIVAVILYGGRLCRKVWP